MRAGRGRPIALASAALGLAVLVATAVAGRGWITETWWIYQLGSSEPEKKLEAARNLGEMRSRRAIPALVRLYLEHPGMEFESILFNLGSPAISAVLKAKPDIDFISSHMVVDITVFSGCLDYPDPVVRIAALRCMERYGLIDLGETASRVKVYLEKETFLPARLRAAHLISRFEPAWKSIRSAVLVALKSKDAALRLEALEVLEIVGPKAGYVVSALRDELCDPEIELRREAVSIGPLLGTRAERAIPTLRNLAFREQDPDLRAKAQASLMLVLPLVVDVPDSVPEAQEAIPDLLAGLPSARSVEVLGLIGPAARIAIPRLLGILREKTEYEDVRVAAARALARIGGGDETLIAELQDVLVSVTDSHVRGVVARALGDLKCVACVEAFRRFLEDEDSWIQEDAAHALGKIGPAAREAIPELTRLLASPDEPLKFQTALALWQITRESERLLPHLARTIGRYWNLEAVEAAAEIGPAAGEAVPMIADLLWTESSLAAARALARIGGASVPRLVQALAEEDWYPRANAAWALGEIGPEAREAIPALEALARDEDQDEEVRQAAAEALEKIRRGSP